MTTYEITVCPKCLALVGFEDYHEHDGIHYPDLEITVRVGEQHFGQLTANACRDAERAHADAEAAREAERREIARMEAEWRATAPAEQVEALEKSRAASQRTAAAISATVKEVWSQPSVLHGMNGPNPFFATPEQVAKHAEENRLLRIAEALRVITAFDREGPAVISFHRLRDARRKLAELTDPPTQRTT